MLEPTITPERQKEILTQIAQITQDPEPRHFIMLGVTLALGATCPPYWIMNVLAGRTDRLFEEPKERKDYNVLGL